VNALDTQYVDCPEGTYVAEQTGGKLALVDEAGHCAQTEMPEETVSIVIDFLNHI
jgi:hypothetical protein